MSRRGRRPPVGRDRGASPDPGTRAPPRTDQGLLGPTPRLATLGSARRRRLAGLLCQIEGARIKAAPKAGSPPTPWPWAGPWTCPTSAYWPLAGPDGLRPGAILPETRRRPAWSPTWPWTQATRVQAEVGSAGAWRRGSRNPAGRSISAATGPGSRSRWTCGRRGPRMAACPYRSGTAAGRAFGPPAACAWQAGPSCRRGRYSSAPSAWRIWTY